jgi:hypothetical protein
MHLPRRRRRLTQLVLRQLAHHAERLPVQRLGVLLEQQLQQQRQHVAQLGAARWQRGDVLLGCGQHLLDVLHLAVGELDAREAQQLAGDVAHAIRGRSILPQPLELRQPAAQRPSGQRDGGDGAMRLGNALSRVSWPAGAGGARDVIGARQAPTCCR